jgi:hypothetical protein
MQNFTRPLIVSRSFSHREFPSKTHWALGSENGIRWLFESPGQLRAEVRYPLRSRKS